MLRKLEQQNSMLAQRYSWLPTQRLNQGPSAPQASPLRTKIRKFYIKFVKYYAKTFQYLLNGITFLFHYPCYLLDILIMLVWYTRYVQQP